MIALLLASSLFYACGDGAGGGAGSDSGTAAKEKKDPTQNPAYAAGLELVAKSNCPTCHKTDEASTGPSFKSIANKYPNTAETYESLSLKVIKGGTGVWGQIPMTPHPELSQEDATKMVKYILLLKD